LDNPPASGGSLDENLADDEGVMSLQELEDGVHSESRPRRRRLVERISALRLELFIRRR
jgi:hypothetical protein